MALVAMLILDERLKGKGRRKITSYSCLECTTFWYRSNPDNLFLFFFCCHREPGIVRLWRKYLNTIISDWFKARFVKKKNSKKPQSELG